MTLITFQDGQVVFRDGAVGTEQSCCCDGGGEGPEPEPETEGVCTIVPDDCNSDIEHCSPGVPEGEVSDCDPRLPNLPTGVNTVCSDDTLTQFTVTGSGYVANFSLGTDAASEQEFQDVINAAYVIDLNCQPFNPAVALFNVGTWGVQVTADFTANNRSASISVSGVSSNGNWAVAGSIAYQDGGLPQIQYSCGTRENCSNYSGTHNVAGLVQTAGDPSGASVDLSGL